ncbi:MAG: response regulator [Tissierellaceae bacterium]|jgi:two-component system response regulator DegU|nr:response regulator transcription factor [Tissierellia bacterium]
MSIRVMIVDDHQLFREGIKSILSATKDILVVSEAADGETAITQAHIHNPDIILLDIVMPHIDGIRTLRRMKDLGIKSRIIILSAHSSKNYIINAIKLGASGYITKDNNRQNLIQVIRRVASGGKYLQPSLGMILRQNLEEEEYDDYSEDIKKMELLSRREFEILTLVARGNTNKEIGNKLFISEKTVKNHMTQIFKKIEVEDRVQAVIFAYKNSIIEV